MNRLCLRKVVACVLLVGAGLLVPGWAKAAEQEVRDFAIYVDGKSAGPYQMTITRQDDGTVTLDARSQCVVKILLVTAYSYTYQAREVWKGAQLLSFDSQGQENSKPFKISARLEGAALRVQANGRELAAQASAWPTSIWQLPPAKAECMAAPGKAVPLFYLGSDTGLEAAGHLQFIGMEQVKVAGQEVTCSHYKVMKPAVHDVWYDASERMVRDVWTTDGHRSEVVLTGIRR